MIEKSKGWYNGSLGAKPRIEVCQETIPWWRNHNRSRALMLEVGEIPLNRKGLPLTSNVEGEEIVQTHMKV